MSEAALAEAVAIVTQAFPGAKPLSVATAPPSDADVFAFLAEEEPSHDWVIPGLLERGDRLILTGGEGAGKSTLLRQIATQAASGLHPFDLNAIDPRRVLLVDLENPRALVRRALGPLVESAGGRLQPAMLFPVVAAAGLDLLQAQDAAWLEERAEASRAELLILGPLYKLADCDPTAEEPAKRIASILDGIRERHRCALIIEAHSPHAQEGRTRPKRPYGASLWMRWPDLGLHLADSGALIPWRTARDERQWPKALQHGDVWPWTHAEPSSRTTIDVDKAALAERAIREHLARGGHRTFRQCHAAVQAEGIRIAKPALEDIWRRVVGATS